MAPRNSPVVRAGSTASTSAWPATSVAPHSQLEHTQDTLSPVKDPKAPITESDTPPHRLLPPIPTPTSRHVTFGTSPVLLRIDEASATNGIDNMTTCAWRLLNRWPLSGLFKFAGGAGNTTAEAPAYQAKETEADAGEDAPKVLQEEDMNPGVAPPSYFDLKP